MASSSSITILTCTANMGNAEPTASSMKCWVPELGDCSKVTPLSGSPTPLEGSFDVICIGMQEATWKKKDKSDKANGSHKPGGGEEEEGLEGAEHSNEDHTEIDEDDLEELAMSQALELQEEAAPEATETETVTTESTTGGDEPKKKKKLNLVKAGKKAVSKVESTGKAAAKTGYGAAKTAARTVESTGKAAAKTATAAGKTAAKTATTAALMAQKTAQKTFEMTTEALLKEPDSDYLRELLGETLGDKYHLLKEYQRGQMRLYLYVKKPLVEEITGLDLKAENTGIGNVLANKGGIVCTFTIRKTRVSFLTAHLAAHEGDNYYKARNDNLRDILRGAKVGPKHLNGLDNALTSHHMFVMGDLNYRTRLPNKDDLETPEQVKAVLEIVQQKDWKKLYSYDELSKGIEKKEVLVQFETLPCDFNPTFKMLREEGFQHKDQRVPSYTDRVLYTSAPGLSKNLMPLAYEPCPGFITSDHKPLRGVYSIKTSCGRSSSSTGDNPQTEPVSMVFKNMKCTNLPPADMDGFADPYLMFMSDPVGLVVDDRDKKSQKKRPGFDGKHLPASNWIKKTLNPDWSDEVRLCIHETDSAQMEGAMLYLMVWDYDVGTDDDLMCSMVLNIKDLTTFEEGQNEKEIKIDQPLLKYGLEKGNIKGTIVVSRGNILNQPDKKDKSKRKMSIFSSFGKALNSMGLGGSSKNLAGKK